LKRLARERIGTAFKISDWPEYSWVAVTKAQVAELLNSSFLQAHLCLAASADIPKEEFTKKINMPSAEVWVGLPPVGRHESHPAAACPLGKVLANHWLGHPGVHPRCAKIVNLWDTRKNAVSF
jgi:hypothetical protein